MSPGRRNLLFAALLALAVLASAFAHVFRRGKQAIEASDAAEARGDLRSAVESAKEAAQSRAPLSPYPDRGKERLRTVAAAAEARADWDTATLAWRALRAACASSAVGRRQACADEADLGLERVAARSGVAMAPKQDDVSPPAWLPVLVLAGIGGLLLAANRARK